MTNWQPGMRITAARLNDGIDSTIIATGVVAQAGWSVNSFRAVKSGKNVEIELDLLLTAGPIPSGTFTPGSNLPDQFVATVPVGCRPTSGFAMGTFDDGYTLGGWILDTDGTCTLRTTISQLQDEHSFKLHTCFNL